MQTYETLLTVTEDDLDELNHVNNVRYVQWVQEVAKAHWVEFTSEDIKKAYFWIMLSHAIVYKRPALLNETLRLKTYVIKTEGVTSTRIVEIINNKTNKLLAKSETTWCFMSFETMKPARITDEVVNLFH